MDLSNPIRNLYNSVSHPSHEDVKSCQFHSRDWVGWSVPLLEFLLYLQLGFVFAFFLISILAGFDHSVKAKLKWYYVFWLGHQILILLRSEFWDKMSKPSTFNLTEILGCFVIVTAQTNVLQILWLKQTWVELTHMADPCSCVPGQSPAESESQWHHFLHKI